MKITKNKTTLYCEKCGVATAVTGVLGFTAKKYLREFKKKHKNCVSRKTNAVEF